MPVRCSGSAFLFRDVELLRHDRLNPFSAADKRGFRGLLNEGGNATARERAKSATKTRSLAVAFLP
jgi:hypothetical protein